MRTIAVAMLAMILLVNGAYSQAQNWIHEELGNPIDGKWQVQYTESIGPSSIDPPATLVVSNKGHEKFSFIGLFKDRMCTFSDNDVLHAKAAFDENVHDMIALLQPKGAIKNDLIVSVYFPFADDLIDLIHESDNLYFRLYQDCGHHIDYEFDVSGPVTIPDPS